jgi:hypothetical protein
MEVIAIMICIFCHLVILLYVNRLDVHGSIHHYVNGRLDTSVFSKFVVLEFEVMKDLIVLSALKLSH